MGIRIKLRELLSCYRTVNSIKRSHMVCRGCVFSPITPAVKQYFSKDTTAAASVAPDPVAPSHFATFIHNLQPLRNQIKFLIILFITNLCVRPPHFFSKGANFVVITLCSNPLLERQSHRWRGTELVL